MGLKIKSKFWFIVVLSYWIAPIWFFFVIKAKGLDSLVLLVVLAHVFGDFIISALMAYTNAFEWVKKEKEVG